MSSISRRKLISVGAAAGAAALMPPAVMKIGLGRPVLAATSSVGSLLRAVPISDPSSGELLDEYFPGVQSRLGYYKLLPVAFLVSNTSGGAVRAFSSHWSLVTPEAQQELIVDHYFHRRSGHRGGMHWGATGNHTRFTALVPAIQAGEARLVTPFFNWSSTYFRAQSDKSWSKMLSHRSRPQVNLTALQGAGTNVTMNIVAAVTDDFGATGPYADKLAKVVRVSRNAEHDEAAAILAYISAGATAEQVKYRLQFHASGLAFDINPNWDLYYRVRQRQAKVLLRRLRHARWDQFLRTLEYLKRKPKTTTHIVSLA